MKSRFRSALIAAVLGGGLLAGCGGVPLGAGIPCDQAGTLPTCRGDEVELFCDPSQSNKVAEAPCRGSGGCLVSGDQVTCDLSADLPGDGCPPPDEGLQICDGDALLVCYRSAFKQVQVCQNGCAVDSTGQAACQ